MVKLYLSLLLTCMTCEIFNRNSISTRRRLPRHRGSHNLIFILMSHLWVLGIIKIWMCCSGGKKIIVDFLSYQLWHVTCFAFLLLPLHLNLPSALVHMSLTSIEVDFYPKMWKLWCVLEIGWMVLLVEVIYLVQWNYLLLHYFCKHVWI